MGGGGKEKGARKGPPFPPRPSPGTTARAGNSPGLPGLSFPQRERCWALTSGSQCGPSLRIPGSWAPPGAVDSEAGRGAWESEFSGVPQGIRLHTCSAEVFGTGSPGLLVPGSQRGCSAAAWPSPLTEIALFLLNVSSEWYPESTWALNK